MNETEQTITLAPRKVTLAQGRRGCFILVADVLSYLTELEAQAKANQDAMAIIRLLRGRMEEALR